MRSKQVWFLRNKLLFLILALGLLSRIVNIDQSLWLDEAISVNSARNLSVNELLTRFSPGDFHPPLYYLLLKAWISIFGASEISARSLSVLFGIATVWVVFLIGRRLFSSRLGLVAALFIATAPLHVYYSQEARMYVPTTFFATILVWFFVKVLKAKGIKNWVGLILASTLLIYMDYPAAFVLVALGFYLVLFERVHLRAFTKTWLLSGIIILLLFVPWLPTLFQQLKVGLGVKESLPGWWQALGRTNPKELALVPVKFMIGRISFFDKAFYAAFVGVSAIFFGILLVKGLALWRKTQLLWFWCLMPPIIFAILGLQVSGFSYFRLLFVLPAFYLILAAGIFSLDRRLQIISIATLAIFNLVTTSIYLFTPRFHREDWRSAASWIRENSREKAGTLFVGQGQMEPYHYYNPGVPAFGQTGWEEQGFDTIYLMRYVQPILDPQDLLRQKVEENGYQKLGEHDFNGVVVWEYQK